MSKHVISVVVRINRPKRHTFAWAGAALAALLLAFGFHFLPGKCTAGDEERGKPAQSTQPKACLEKEDEGPTVARVEGKSLSYRIQSNILRQTRRVSIATPASYAHTSRRYPVIVVFDGDYLGPDVVNAAGYLAEE